MHVDVRITKSNGKIFNGRLLHLGGRERAQLTFGVRRPFTNDLAVVDRFVRPPVMLYMLILLTVSQGAVVLKIG